jgi:hypothetical protein
MTEEPRFKERTKIKGTTFSIPKAQMRILWYLDQGATVETWCANMPTGRMWTTDGGMSISPRSISALWDKKLVVRSTKVIERERKIRTRWEISPKGRKIVETYT